MRVLVAMSGGVDSSVAAALLVSAGHEVVGATMKLWGGESDSGCCSVADVDDARRVTQQLGIAHHVFNFSADFDRHVVAPYIEAHATGFTPNPCIACNRHLKFDRFARRAWSLGFERIATGHHARVLSAAGGGAELHRGADPLKDQSYVLHMIGTDLLERLLLPVGTMTKAEVRAEARRRGIRTADKPDSQDVCFISRSGGREAFLGERIALHPGTVVDASGATVATVAAVELITVGQRRGLGSTARIAGTTPAERSYAVEVDIKAARVTVGSLADLLVDEIAVDGWLWSGDPLDHGSAVEIQVSAHGEPVPGRWLGEVVALDVAIRRVPAGQSVVAYVGERVVGGGTAA